jgi:hypothetical protein
VASFRNAALIGASFGASGYRWFLTYSRATSARAARYSSIGSILVMIAMIIVEETSNKLLT